MSRSRIRAARLNSFRLGGYWNASRGMFSDALGVCDMAQWAERRPARQAWKDSLSAPRTTNDSAGACYTRNPMDCGGQARRGLGLARKNSERPPGTERHLWPAPENARSDFAARWAQFWAHRAKAINCKRRENA
jgi:hypothetical protein